MAMVRVPVLTVEDDKGMVAHIEIEARKGTGTLFLDTKLCTDKETQEALGDAFSLFNIKKKDVLVRAVGKDLKCLCGGSLGLSAYLGMYACLRGLRVKPGTFITGGINKKGKILPVGEVAAKIRAILGKADVVLVPAGQGLPVVGIQVKEVSNLKAAIRLALTK